MIKPSEDTKPVIEIGETVVVKDLSEKMNLKVTDLISELMKNKIFVNLNESIDFDTAVLVGEDLGFEIVKLRSDLERGRQMFKSRVHSHEAKKRPPVVVVMGHVDHGKTTLLDKILSTNVASGESGGITQHVNAYQVEKRGQMITFMDTPGHEAFHSMRERGAYITDLAIIVVAADDGVKPQTKEAVKFAKSAELPIIVAINKIDKPEANIERVKKDLADIDLLTEDWGGNTVCVNISAKTGEGIDNLLEMILLYSDMEDLKAEYDSPFEGFVMESHLNPKVGPIATVLIQNGTMNIEDYVAAGSMCGRIKIIKDFKGESIEKAGPSAPVTILGLNEVPRAGLVIKAYETRKEAEEVAMRFSQTKEAGFKSGGRIISATKNNEDSCGDKMEKVNLIIKADTKGSLEAIIQILESIKSDNVAVQILKTGVGEITETDVKLAQSSGAKIIGFNSRVDSNTKKFAEKEKVDFQMFSIIYELASYVKAEMSALLGTEIVRTDLGKMKVVAVFKLPKKSAKTVDMIFGAKVENGKVEKSSKLEIFRNGEKVGEGNIRELQHNKKAVSDLKSGNNAGVTFYGNVVVQEGDDIVVYKEEEKRKTI
jgi:translation initiation factor IF-2